VGEESTLSAMLFNTVMDETVRTVTAGQESGGIPETIVYAYKIIIWEPKESASVKKFHRVLTMCTF
jgi:hypothetical protein